MVLFVSNSVHPLKKLDSCAPIAAFNFKLNNYSFMIRVIFMSKYVPVPILKAFQNRVLLTGFPHLEEQKIVKSRVRLNNSNGNFGACDHIERENRQVKGRGLENRDFINGL